VSFAVINLHVACQRVFIVVSVYFVIDSVRKLLVTPSYFGVTEHRHIFPLIVRICFLYFLAVFPCKEVFSFLNIFTYPCTVQSIQSLARFETFHGDED